MCVKSKNNKHNKYKKHDLVMKGLGIQPEVLGWTGELVMPSGSGGLPLKQKAGVLFQTALFFQDIR